MKRHVILGREANVVAVQMMFNYLVETLEDILPFAQTSRLSRSAISWREGAAERLGERIQKKAYEMQHPKQEATASTQKMGVMLRSVVQSEYEANYDALYGAGSYAAAQARYEAEKASRVNTPKKEETAAEKAKREKDSERFWEKMRRERQRENERRDHSAFNAGREVGDKISLQDRLV